MEGETPPPKKKIKSDNKGVTVKLMGNVEYLSGMVGSFNYYDEGIYCEFSRSELVAKSIVVGLAMGKIENTVVKIEGNLGRTGGGRVELRV